MPLRGLVLLLAIVPAIASSSVSDPALALRPQPGDGLVVVAPIDLAGRYGFDG